MSVRVFGLGLGVFILTLLWTFAIIACLTLSRPQGFMGGLGPIAGAAVISLILVFFPRRVPTIVEEIDVRVFDPIFIPRTVTTVLLALILLVAFGYFVKSHLAQPVRARSVRMKRIH